MLLASRPGRCPLCNPNHRLLLTSWLSISLTAFLAGSPATTLAADGQPIGALNPADPMDWPHWRGPAMNGVSMETNLPESWSPSGENLLWKIEEFGTRSSPVVLNGRLYVVCRAEPESTLEQERIVCLDAATGELMWEHRYNIFLSDAPAERVGWSSVVADPESQRVYALGLGASFHCLDANTGEVFWERSMIEEFGMLSTYGGRTNYPTIFEDLVIISGVNTGWGETSIPAHRFFAFDKLTGAMVWTRSTQLRPEDTTYSAPVLTAFDGQAAMVVGAGDGRVYAFQPRTGQTIWEYHGSNRGINTTPLVHDGIVYCGHSEQDAADTTKLGALFAFDGRTSGVIPEDQLLWKHVATTVGRSSPVRVEDRLYAIEDGGNLMTLDAESGKILGQRKIGRIMFGSPLYADGKLYIAEQTGRIYIMRPTADGVEIVHQTRLPTGEEIFGSPVISHGRLYIPSTGGLYCIADSEQTPSTSGPWQLPEETWDESDQEVASIVLAPAEMMLQPSQRARVQVRAYNARGQYLKQLPEANIAIDGGGTLLDEQIYQAPSENQVAGVRLTASYQQAESQARVRVIPNLPWEFGFDDGQVPPVWIGANYRHRPAEFEGEKTLVKVSTIPKGTRSQAFMGWTELHDYTVEADFYPLITNGNLPSVGLVNQRYTLDLQARQNLQIRSWVSRLELRFAKTIDFAWEGDRWYRMKFQSESFDDRVELRGKVWPRDEPEPDQWQIEAADVTPNRRGSPGLFGNATNSQFYIDNVKVYSNQP
jgi:outer membrane protein assembly factor BamB